MPGPKSEGLFRKVTVQTSGKQSGKYKIAVLLSAEQQSSSLTLSVLATPSTALQVRAVEIWHLKSPTTLLAPCFCSSGTEM